ncbi:MAG: hypothetical protein AB8G15_01550 [Saprospiraceae bacterium]
MEFAHLIRIIITILIFASCQESKHPVIDGTYFMVGEEAKSITIKDSLISFANTEEPSGIKQAMLYTDKNGDLKETPNCEKVRFSIDAIDANQGIYISAFKGEYRCYAYHLIKENQFLSVTPLKSLEGIEFHFTSPTLYKLNPNPIDNGEGKDLTILVDNEIKLNTINYVAFDQNLDETSKEYDQEKMTITLDSSGINKSSILLNPMYYARKKYVAKYTDQLKGTTTIIPVIYHQSISTIQTEFTKEQQKSELQKLKVKDLYLIAYRFNPGRKRVVNKAFKEAINGQVQAFELRSLEKDYQ